MEYFIAAIPDSESELAVMVSLLDAHEIPHYVQNRGFGSLYPGMQIPIYNVQRIMVPYAYAEETAGLLGAFCHHEENTPSQETLGLGDRLRVIAELLLGGWAFPVRHRKFDRRADEAGPASGA